LSVSFYAEANAMLANALYFCPINLWTF